MTQYINVSLYVQHIYSTALITLTTKLRRGRSSTVVVHTRILSKNLSQTVARKIPHSVTIRIGMNKMAEGEEHLDCLDETLKQVLACLFL